VRSARRPRLLLSCNSTVRLMSISFLPYVRDDARDQWVIPALARADGDAFEMSVSNGNAVELLLALGLSPEPDGIFTLDAFSGLVTAALRRHLDQRSPEIAPAEHAEPGKMTMIHLGRSEGYIERRLGDLAGLVQRSRLAGATHIGWG
jgi:hypothetical protein